MFIYGIRGAGYFESTWCQNEAPLTALALALPASLSWIDMLQDAGGKLEVVQSLCAEDLVLCSV